MSKTDYLNEFHILTHDRKNTGLTLVAYLLTQYLQAGGLEVEYELIDEDNLPDLQKILKCKKDKQTDVVLELNSDCYKPVITDKKNAAGLINSIKGYQLVVHIVAPHSGITSDLTSQLKSIFGDQARYVGWHNRMEGGDKKRVPEALNQCDSVVHLPYLGVDFMRILGTSKEQGQSLNDHFFSTNDWVKRMHIFGKLYPLYTELDAAFKKGSCTPVTKESKHCVAVNEGDPEKQEEAVPDECTQPIDVSGLQNLVRNEIKDALAATSDQLAKFSLVIPDELRYRDVLGYLNMTVGDASGAISKEFTGAKEKLMEQTSALRFFLFAALVLLVTIIALQCAILRCL